ncbi:CLUMA_CG013981, isoform A [Clunio marinus]|uniref:CLUMA_CG013981, isoform A n=1 Tax=Clunio marinus TaxID=568069 RepID=A0A1J1IMD5_9DIPT|nr:CLUMA_CG013981, isoform A [Clunio marinus]
MANNPIVICTLSVCFRDLNSSKHIICDHSFAHGFIISLLNIPKKKKNPHCESENHCLRKLETAKLIKYLLKTTRQTLFLKWLLKCFGLQSSSVMNWMGGWKAHGQKAVKINEMT